MDAVRSTARLITQAALVTVAVTERLTVAMLRSAVDRAERLLRLPGPSARDAVLPDGSVATLYEKTRI